MTAPMAMHRSPMLKTLWNGQLEGMAKMSPRNARLGSATTPEFVNSPGFTERPAAARADADAGMIPLLDAMAARFAAPPSEISQIPGTRQLLKTKYPARRYEATCAPLWSAGEPSGNTEMIRT
jgi:hypothetical protein